MRLIDWQYVGEIVSDSSCAADISLGLYRSLCLLLLHSSVDSFYGSSSQFDRILCIYLLDSGQESLR